MVKNTYLVASLVTIIMLLGVGCSSNAIKEQTPAGNQEKEQVFINKTAKPEIKKELEVEAEIKNEPIEELEVVKKESETSEPVVTVVDCGVDFECFKNRARSCLKTKYLSIITTEMDEVPGYAMHLKTPYEITGEVSGECKFYYMTGVIEATATEEAIKTMMEMGQMTREEVEASLAQINEGSLGTNSLKADCYTSKGQNIVDHIEAMMGGVSSLIQHNNEMTYEGNVFCTAEEKYYN